MYIFKNLSTQRVHSVLFIDQSFVFYLKNFAECYLKTNTLPGA